MLRAFGFAPFASSALMRSNCPFSAGMPICAAHSLSDGAYGTVAM